MRKKPMDHVDVALGYSKLTGSLFSLSSGFSLGQRMDADPVCLGGVETFDILQRQGLRRGAEVLNLVKKGTERNVLGVSGEAVIDVIKFVPEFRGLLQGAIQASPMAIRHGLCFEICRANDLPGDVLLAMDEFRTELDRQVA